MKIFIPNVHADKDMIGGGWSFIRNLQEGAGAGLEFVVSKDYQDCDAVLIAGSTMADKHVVEECKRQGKKIVLRIDNMPRNSRNRGAGFSRLKKYYEMADVVVYQSQWAKDYIDPFFNIKKESVVILNGVNRDIYQAEGSKVERDQKKWVMLYSRHNRDETKRWEQAWYEYSIFHRDLETKPELWLCGRFSPEQVEWNFDFFNGENVKYWGDIQDREQMASILRSVDVLLLPYYNDACSNTLIEARQCGVDVIIQNDSGGNKEIMDASLEHLCNKRMAEDYGKIFFNLLELQV